MLSGAHLTLVPKVVEGLRGAGLGDVVVVVGGIIPAEDVPKLKEIGVAEVFTPGASLAEIASWLERVLDEREAALERG
jgi:methylmalonyl-CoA mutase C-terminal domain/subunit